MQLGFSNPTNETILKAIVAKGVDPYRPVARHFAS